MIFGLDTTEDLPDNYVPLEAVAVIKCLNEEGTPTLVLACTEALASWEALGMLTAAATSQDWHLQSGFESSEEEEDGDEE